MIYLLILISICSVIYTVARYHNSHTTLKIIQPVTTLLILILASLGIFIYEQDQYYTVMILLALSAALAGDCNLIELQDNKKFFIAVLFYWMGITGYAIILTLYTDFLWLSLVPFSLLILLSAVTVKKFLWKGMRENKLTLPITLYTLTWCFLLSQSLTLFFCDNSLFNRVQKSLILGGTGIYFIADLNLSFHKFSDNFKEKPYWLGALLYVIGQTLLALSVSFFEVLKF